MIVGFSHESLSGSPKPPFRVLKVPYWDPEAEYSKVEGGERNLGVLKMREKKTKKKQKNKRVSSFKKR